MKKSIRRQVYGKDENDFVFSLNDKRSIEQLEWEGDDEFRLNGEMYDLIEKKVEDNKLILRCLSDKKETALLTEAQNHWRENEKSNKIVSELLQFLQTLFHNPVTDEVAIIRPTENNTHFLLKRLPSQVKKIPTPPPQFAIS